MANDCLSITIIFQSPTKSCQIHIFHHLLMAKSTMSYHVFQSPLKHHVFRRAPSCLERLSLCSSGSTSEATSTRSKSSRSTCFDSRATWRAKRRTECIPGVADVSWEQHLYTKLYVFTIWTPRFSNAWGGFREHTWIENPYGLMTCCMDSVLSSWKSWKEHPRIPSKQARMSCDWWHDWWSKKPV